MPTKAELDANATAIANANAYNAQVGAKRAKIEAQIAPLQTQLTGAKTVFNPLESKANKIIDSQGGAMSKRGLNVITSTPYQTSFGTIQTVGPQVESLTNQLNSLQFMSVPNALSGSTNGNDILRAKFQQLQIPDEIIDSSISFIEALMEDGLTQENAIDIYYNNKDFTTKTGNTVSSPFYAMFTFLRESAPKTGVAPSPLELMQFKLGVKNLVSQYKRSPLFASDESLKKYVANDIDIVTLDKRFTEASIKETEADPTYVLALQKMGYISGSQNLGDFYLDPEIGKKQFELNKQTGAFAQQALKAASQGVNFDAARLTQLAAPFAGAGTAQQVASEGYATIGQQLNPLTKLEGIYNRQAVDQTALTPEIQKQLEEEQFRGTASELRKKRIEQEQLSFQAQSGTIVASRLTGGSLAQASVLNQV
jgi:hypothetical protein